jgi:ribosomal protein S3
LVFTNIIKHYINFNFFKFLWDIVNKFNKRNLRNDINQYKKSGLIAFKMAFKGRFSRKQRASSIWYAHGRASLNRLDLKVDYAFVKVPLKNSIVSIKIWLFRNFKLDKFKFILNF